MQAIYTSNDIDSSIINVCMIDQLSKEKKKNVVQNKTLLYKNLAFQQNSRFEKPKTNCLRCHTQEISFQVEHTQSRVRDRSFELSILSMICEIVLFLQLTVRMLPTLDLALRVSTSRSNCCFQSVSNASSCNFCSLD